MTTQRGFKPIMGVPATDAQIDAFAATRGVPTLHLAEPAPTPIQAAAEIPPKSPTARLTLELPEYLVDILRNQAAHNKCSTRYLVLLALQKDGYKVDDADLFRDARRSS
jgi:hypothetical protein